MLRRQNLLYNINLDILPIKYRVTTRIVNIVFKPDPKENGAHWNPFDIKHRISKSNLAANENDFFLPIKIQNNNHTKTHKFVEKRGI